MFDPQYMINGMLLLMFGLALLAAGHNNDDDKGSFA